jgi:L-iditol 2-dehydrogenase
MKAVAKVKREPGVAVIEAPPDPVGEYQVRLRTRVASICGSDLGFFDFTPAYQKFAKVPVIMGHEFAGEVSEVGKDVHDFKMGERVCCESVIYCGTCRFCRSGMTNICLSFKVFGMQVNGGFSEYVSVDQRFLHRLPDEVNFLEAGVVEPLSVVVNALDDVARHGYWRNAAVVGPGPLGLLSAEVLHAKGITDLLVVGVSPDSARLEIAKNLGYDILNSDVSDPAEATRELTDGYGFDIVVVAAGAPSALKAAIPMISKGGQVIVIGIFPDEVPLPVSDLVRRQVSLAGSYGSSWAHYEQAIQLLKHKRIRAEAIVTHKFALDEAGEAFETAKSKKGCKVEFNA